MTTVEITRSCCTISCVRLWAVEMACVVLEYHMFVDGLSRVVNENWPNGWPTPFIIGIEMIINSTAADMPAL